MGLYSVFWQIVNMSFTASIMIPVILIARLFLRRTPRIFSYILWIAVLFRLLCPVSFSSPFSLLELIDSPVTASGEVNYLPAPPESVTTIFPPEGAFSTPPAEESPSLPDLKAVLISVGTWVWLGGLLFLLFRSLFSVIRLRRRLSESILLRENIWLADHLDTPFVLGIFSPKIYLPSDLRKEEQDFLILHEQIHLRRGDHLLKTAALCALCLHWFNPLVWLALALADEDMEISCDEAVLKEKKYKIRTEYSQSLLRLSAGKSHTVSMFPSFGKGNITRRIKTILSCRRPPLWLTTSGFLLVLCLLLFLAGNPLGASSLSACVDPVGFAGDLPVEINDPSTQRSNSFEGILYEILAAKPRDLSFARSGDLPALKAYVAGQTGFASLLQRFPESTPMLRRGFALDSDREMLVAWLALLQSDESMKERIPGFQEMSVEEQINRYIPETFTQYTARWILRSLRDLSGESQLRAMCRDPQALWTLKSHGNDVIDLICGQYPGFQLELESNTMELDLGNGFEPVTFSVETENFGQPDYMVTLRRSHGTIEQTWVYQCTESSAVLISGSVPPENYMTNWNTK